MSTGKVWLVGAGPGDPGLFTVKGREILQNAEVVVYDSLVGQGVLSQIPKEAKAINVGKRHGKPVVYQVDAGRMAQDGYPFYLSANGVWLTREVPARFLRRLF